MIHNINFSKIARTEFSHYEFCEHSNSVFQGFSTNHISIEQFPSSKKNSGNICNSSEKKKIAADRTTFFRIISCKGITDRFVNEVNALFSFLVFHSALEITFPAI